MLTPDQATIITERLEYCDSLEVRMDAIDSISEILEIKLRDNGVDSFITELSVKNQELLESENNIKKKLAAKTIEAAHNERQYLIEVDAHHKTSLALREKNARLYEVEMQLAEQKKTKRILAWTVGGVGAAFLIALITGIALK